MMIPNILDVRFCGGNERLSALILAGQSPAAGYLAGSHQKELATRYGIGLSSVKTILRQAGARKYMARV